jgi:hypothetical protein
VPVECNSVGPVGPVLPVGPVGPVLPVGPVGPVLPVGPVGPVLPVGPVGPVAVGAQGIAGAVGAQGIAGAVGAQGIAGAVGAQGIAGAVGAQGIAGAVGAQGIAGAVGLGGTLLPNTNPIGIIGSGSETIETPLDGTTFANINSQINESAIVDTIQTYNDATTSYINQTFVIPPSLYNTTIGYVELQNPIGDVPQYYSTTIYDDCLEEAIIVMGVGEDCIDCFESILNSLFEDPDFMNPANWVVHVIDEYGRVSFTPIEYYNDFILDWNATEQMSQLYQSVGALFTQYTYGSFYIDTTTNNLIPYVDNGNLYVENPNSITNAVVDPNHIGCGSLDNVSIVFASEAWSGFKLPEVTDCSCKVDFSFDYMIKYQTENLNECVTRINCYPAIIHDNSLNSLSCMNFVSFTNSVEDSSLLENNFNDIEDVTEEYVIWQNTQQNEPTVECCNAVGGNITPMEDWYSLNYDLLLNIDNTYIEIFGSGSSPNDSELLNTLDFDYSELITYGTDLNTIGIELSDTIDECYLLNIEEPVCFIDFNLYITTTNICMLQIPLEYGLWTNLYLNYKNTIEGINGVISQYESNCLSEELEDIIAEDMSTIPSPCDPEIPNPCCNQEILNYLNNTLELLQTKLLEIENITESVYDQWYSEILSQYNDYINSTESYLTLIDNLKLNFKLFVDNNNLVYTNQVDSNLTYLPYTQSVNPFWEFNPSVGYSGIILEGTEQDIDLIEDSIYTELSNSNTPYNSNLFEPNWNTFNFTIPNCVCDDLRILYPNKEFFFSVEIENYNCSVCLLVDNIIINVSDCKTERLVSLNNCLIPQLSCVIDNKKSWVHTDQGIIRETVYPDGPCNTTSTSNYQIVKMGTPEDRLWTDLEYRYTNYDVNHSDLIINVKNTTFSIDPAKAIECDVFNYWKNIDCSGSCPTSCTSASTVVYDGQVYSSTTLVDYTLDLSASTSGLTFSCSTITNSLETIVTNLKNQYYTLTSDYINSLNATYYDLQNLGYPLSNFNIQNNNCGTDTIVINNNQSTNNLFSLITENYDGTLSVYESYIFSGSTPYTGGTLVEVLSGITAQTFNQTTFVNEDCCNTLNNLLNSEGVNGLGIGKNYQWDTNNGYCVWKPIDGCSVCEGDCEYCGTLNECSNGHYTGSSYNICINPLDYLDIQPSEINVKDVFDQLVQSNLIDVKSRQTISDYPLLRLFYELYLNANNCGKELSGKFTYNTMFEFMDKIGDYWLNLLEQVVPATTIWEGCDNSGKIYRNTIFDQNKYQYKRYSLNLIETTTNCLLSGYTDFSIGSEGVYSLVEQIPLFPSNNVINNIKNQIKIKTIQIDIVKDNIVTQNKILCSLNLQDFDTPNLQAQIDSVTTQITLLTNNLNNLETQLNDLYTNLSNEETQYILQQQNYYSNFTSCSGLTETLVLAESNLNNFIPGTILYERQRNYIAILRDKVNKCVRISNTLISDYNTVFITQIYDTNEYEGNVTIIGDPDWEEGGYFYNQELIHNCTTE